MGLKRLQKPGFSWLGVACPSSTHGQTSTRYVIYLAFFGAIFGVGGFCRCSLLFFWGGGGGGGLVVVVFVVVVFSYCCGCSPCLVVVVFWVVVVLQFLFVLLLLLLLLLLFFVFVGHSTPKGKKRNQSLFSSVLGGPFPLFPFFVLVFLFFSLSLIFFFPFLLESLDVVYLHGCAKTTR